MVKKNIWQFIQVLRTLFLGENVLENVKNSGVSEKNNRNTERLRNFLTEANWVPSPQTK